VRDQAPRPSGEPAIPALRTDIEFRPLRDGRIEIRDPHLLQVLMVDGDDFRVAQAFDGRLGPRGIEQKLKGEDRRVSRRRVLTVADDFEELRLLDTPEVRDAEPQHENVSPYTTLGGRKGLEVLPVAEPGATWTCHGCGHCCHGLAVELSPEEEARIDARLYPDILGSEPFYEDAFIEPDQPTKRVLRQQEDRDEACIFLSPEGLCHVHARQGIEAKPNACQLFPYMVVAMPRRPPRLGVRVNCHSMYKSFDQGPKLSTHAEHVLRVLATKGPGTEIHKAPTKVEFFGREMTLQRYEEILSVLRDSIAKDGLTAETLARFDLRYLGGRAGKSRQRFGARMLAYMVEEKGGPVPIESGAYGDQVRRIPRGKRAYEAMSLGLAAPEIRPRVAAFFTRQIGHVLYGLGTLNAPDGGYGLLSLILGIEAAMHAAGKSLDLEMANLAFDAFTSPLLESLEHLWPILEAIEPRYVKGLKKEMDR
jgi:Fe-S-cluster containining protein